jgi:hypothetical protein
MVLGPIAHVFFDKNASRNKKWKYEKPMVSLSKIDVFKVSGR